MKRRSKFKRDRRKLRQLKEDLRKIISCNPVRFPDPEGFWKSVEKKFGKSFEELSLIEMGQVEYFLDCGNYEDELEELEDDE